MAGTKPPSCAHPTQVPDQDGTSISRSFGAPAPKVAVAAAKRAADSLHALQQPGALRLRHMATPEYSKTKLRIDNVGRADEAGAQFSWLLTCSLGLRAEVSEIPMVDTSKPRKRIRHYINETEIKLAYLGDNCVALAGGGEGVRPAVRQVPPVQQLLQHLRRSSWETLDMPYIKTMQYHTPQNRVTLHHRAP